MRTSPLTVADSGAFIQVLVSSSCLSVTHETEHSRTITCHIYMKANLHFLGNIPQFSLFIFWMNEITFHLTGCGNDVPEGFSTQRLSNHAGKAWLQTSIIFSAAGIRFKHRWALAAKLQQKQLDVPRCHVIFGLQRCFCEGWAGEEWTNPGITLAKLTFHDILRRWCLNGFPPPHPRSTNANEIRADVQSPRGEPGEEYLSTCG